MGQMSRHMGLYEHQPKLAPCVRCGRETTNMVMTGFARTGRPKRFTLEGVAWCQVCRCERALAQLEGEPGERAAWARAIWTRYRRMLLRREAATT